MLAGKATTTEVHEEFREQAVKLVSEQNLTVPEAAKRAAPGLIHHSDRGSQYGPQDYRDLLQHFGMKRLCRGAATVMTMPRWKRFWGSLKNGLSHHRRYETRPQAIVEITEHIEILYSRQRRHLRLGNLSPAEFTQQFDRLQQAA